MLDIVLDIRYGLRNLIRWFPIIWFDRDFDWDFLAQIMEFKLRRMALIFDKGYHVGSENDARQCRICAELLKRMTEDNYHENARKAFRGKFAIDHTMNMAKQDQRYLGVLIGKYLTHWWD